MINDIRPYPVMKDSGVLWLGRVPEHWEVKRNKLFLREVNDCSEDGTEELLTVSQYTGITRRRDRISDDGELLTNAASLVGYKRVESGDLVMNIMLAWNGSLGVSAIQGITSPAYSVFRMIRGVEPRFLHYLFRTPLLTGIFKTASTGIVDSRLRLYPEAFLRLPTLLPPPEEQAAIVRFLDHATRRIGKAIRTKQKLIKLLEEEKQAIIHRAVTRGLDSNVRLKPSGVEWLGDVPEHWSLKRFKFLARVTSGQVDPRLPEHRNKILIAPNHIRSGTGQITHQETAEQQGADSGKYEVLKGQIIYSKIRPNLRKAAIATTDCLCSADMYPVTVRESELRTAFLLQLLLSMPFTEYAVDCSLRVAMPKVNREALGECWLWYPPLDEQETVLEFIEQTTAPADRAIGRAGREIELLREYRTRLIADVVTGKLDVREAAAQLPDEAPESGTPEEVEISAEEDEDVADTEPADVMAEEAEAV